jgi:hypothetical protein
MSGAILHRLRYPRHNITRWGLSQPSYVCLDDDKEWVLGRLWQRVLAR